MGKLNDVAWSSFPLERKYRRFKLEYPVRLKVQQPDLMVEFEAVSRDISICGMLLETSAMIPRHTAVSFIVTVEDFAPGRPIQFVGEGKVVRVDPRTEMELFAIAVECTRPIVQLDRHLEATGT
ncbi:MAG: PilZ domain-containing protein [Terriglobales bacterium]|jgi:hypothetical protein